MCCADPHWYPAFMEAEWQVTLHRFMPIGDLNKIILSQFTASQQAGHIWLHDSYLCMLLPYSQSFTVAPCQIQKELLSSQGLQAFGNVIIR